MIPRTFWRALALGALIAVIGLFVWQLQIGGIAPADADRANTYRAWTQFRGSREPPHDVAVIDIATPFDALRPKLELLPGWAQCLSDSLGKPLPDDRWPRCAKARLLDALSALGASEIVVDLFLDT